jgi:hypothetical protein
VLAWGAAQQLVGAWAGAQLARLVGALVLAWAGAQLVLALEVGLPLLAALLLLHEQQHVH